MFVSSAHPFHPSRPVDWNALRDTLAREAATEALSRDAEEALLKKRARELARPVATSTALQSWAEFVILRIGSERYAVESAHIREALASRELTPLPGVPPTIRGLTVIRGRIVAVADLRRLFGLAALSDDATRKLVVLEARGVEFAVAVDELIIPPAGAVVVPALAANPAGGLDSKYLRGVTADGLILLDLGAISSALTVNAEL